MGVLKNDVGRPSNKTIMIRTILKCIVGVIILGGVAFGAYYLGKTGDNKQNSNKKITQTQKDEGTVIDIDSREVIDTYNKYQISGLLDIMERYSTIDYFGYFYSQDKIENKDVSDIVKFGLAIKNLYVDEMTEVIDEDKIKNINKTDIDSKIKEMFNSTIDYSVLDKAEYYGQEFTLNKNTGKISYQGAGVGGGFGARTITKIISAKKYNDKIEIIDKVLFTFSEESSGTQVYKTFKLDKNNQLLDEIDSIDPENHTGEFNVDDRLVDKYSDKLDSYKWTFVKQGDNYVFNKVEKIK